MRMSRRGMVDLIVMIVMIVFLLGMGTLAFITYDKAQKERTYVAALREIPARQKSELDAVRARYAELCTHIGFKGEAAYSSPRQIEAMLKEGSRLIADYYNVPVRADGSPDLSGTERGEATVLERAEDGSWKERKVPASQVRGTTRNSKRLYEEAEARSIQGTVGKQDDLIHQLVTSYIPKVKDQRVHQRNLRDTKSAERNADSAEQYSQAKRATDAADEVVKGQHEQLVDRENELARALVDENDALKSLDSETVRETRERAFAMSREAAKARHDAVDTQEAYRVQADKRRKDDSRDPDGFVFLVDEISGWVWINVGQRSGVQLEQTFQVLRPDSSRNSELQIGEIRVKELLRGNIARCRVDALDDQNLYPKAGDLIKNPSFSSRQYQKWALVGTFGRGYTQFTCQELTDILRRVGFQVVDKIDATVDAVIIGGDWRSDTEWMQAKELRLNIETYPEEEVLHFLGLRGPDRK